MEVSFPWFPSVGFGAFWCGLGGDWDALSELESAWDTKPKELLGCPMMPFQDTGRSGLAS